MITDADETAIAALPDADWTPSLHQDGEVDTDAYTAELTGLSTRTGWLPTMRLHRPAHPPGGSAPQQTHRPGTGERLALRHRGHQHRPYPRRSRLTPSTVDRRAAQKPRRGRRPGPGRQGHGPTQPAVEVLGVNRGWVLAANIASDLDAWTRLLGLHDQPDLAPPNPTPCVTGSGTYPPNWPATPAADG